MQRRVQRGRPFVTRWSQWLAERGITSAQLAERTGYSVTTIEAWRSRQRTPRLSGLRSLAMACGMTQKRLAAMLAAPPHTGAGSATG